MVGGSGSEEDQHQRFRGDRSFEGRYKYFKLVQKRRETIPVMSMQSL